MLALDADNLVLAELGGWGLGALVEGRGEIEGRILSKEGEAEV